LTASFQKTLENKPAYNGVCCYRCYTATKEKCVCRCGGSLHGVGTEESRGDNIPGAFILSPDERLKKVKTLEDPLKCHWCLTDLSNENIKAYPHNGGLELEGRSGLFWLYIICPKCGYEWALWKLTKVIEE
jgi:hypothetical protein